VQVGTSVPGHNAGLEDKQMSLVAEEQELLSAILDITGGEWESCHLSGST